VYDAVSVDSPLGGAPASAINLCIDTGLCAAGAAADDMAHLYGNWSQTMKDNAARDARLTSAGTRMGAWGNESDCLYNIELCTTFASGALQGVVATETQWLGISHAIRRNYAYAPHLWNIPASHAAVLEDAATDIAADILP
jgi:hypothetical protein